MGCDIHGYVEVEQFPDTEMEWWTAASDIAAFVGRSYDTFSCLFGVRGYGGFTPVAPGRGLPDDVARTTREEYESWGIDGHSATYITYEEIEDIDWDEPADELDSRYSLLDEDKNPTGMKFSHSSGWTDVIQENRDALDAGEPVPNEDGSAYIQRRRMTRSEAISEEWEWFLHEYLGFLAEKFGPENVRLVVWFDN